MSVILRVLPAVVLVAYSQVIVKWRINHLGGLPGQHLYGLLKYVSYFLDPFIFSAYLAGLVGSLVWLSAIAKLPLALAFPVYQGLTFFAVVVLSAALLHEPMNAPKLLGAAFIFAGIAIGAQG